MARNLLNENLPTRRLEVTITDELADAALTAFFKYFEMQKESRDKRNLFDESESIVADITLSKIFQNNKLKLHRIALPHPIVEDPDPICLIVKSGFRNDLKESILNKNGIELIVTVDELPKEFKQFEERRKLHNSYNKFICDENVQSFLPKILGVGGAHWRKPIYTIKIGQNITEGSLLEKIDTVRSSTYWHFSDGTSISVKIGNTGMPKEQLIANLTLVVPEVISHIPEGWNSISRVGIKSATSIYFPLYFGAPQAPAKLGVAEKKKERKEKPKNGEKQTGKKRFFEKEEKTTTSTATTNGTAAQPATQKKKAQEAPAKKQKVVEEKEEEPEEEEQQQDQEPEDNEEEEEEEVEQQTPTKKAKQTTPKKVTPVSKKDLLKQKVKALSARKASNGNTKPKARKTQTP